jgi:peptidoglycan/xylan/chitin deacetylase (PgdA/CDA1 family)
MNTNLLRLAKRIAKRIAGRPIFGRSILIYHRIADTNFDPWNIAVSPNEFERQLTRLRGKAVLPLREFARLHCQDRLPRSAVAITFDDGYACNALVAAPMLEAFGYPATFFVVSDAVVRSEEFWWDQLEAIFHAPEFDHVSAMQLRENRLANRLGHTDRDDGPFAAFLSLWRMARGLSTEDRRQYLDDLRDRIGMQKETRATHRPMTATELRALAANQLFEIGGHTATHPCLPMLSPAEQEQEIVLGSRSLQVMLGTPIRSFAYPFGEWAPATREIIMAAGFDCAVTAAHRRVRAGDSQFELPRRQVVNSNTHTQ